MPLTNLPLYTLKPIKSKLASEHRVQCATRVGGHVVASFSLVQNVVTSSCASKQKFF